MNELFFFFFAKISNLGGSFTVMSLTEKKNGLRHCFLVNTVSTFWKIQTNSVKQCDADRQRGLHL